MDHRDLFWVPDPLSGGARARSSRGAEVRDVAGWGAGGLRPASTDVRIPSAKQETESVIEKPPNAGPQIIL